MQVLNNGLVSYKLILAGKHSFEYSVTLVKEREIQRVKFPSRVPAEKEFRRCITQFNQLGDVRIC